MALLFCDSFAHYAQANLNLKYTDASNWNSDYFDLTDVGVRRSSSYALKEVGDQTSYLEKGISPVSTAVYVGFALKQDTLAATDGGIINFWNLGTTQISLKITSGGALTLIRGSTTLVATSSGGVITANTWKYIELYVNMTNTGTATVKVNGTVVINNVNGDYQNAGTAGTDSLRLYGISTGIRYLQDLIVMDTYDAGDGLNTFIGDVRIDPIPVDTDGDLTTNWNYYDSGYSADVDDATPDADTSYVYSSTMGAILTFNMAGLPSPTGTDIKAVVVTIVARKDDASTVAVLPVYRNSGSNYTGGRKALGDTYEVHQYVWGENPQDNAAWEDSDVEGGQFGVQFSSSSSSSST